MIELGISTFGETTEIEVTGITPTHDERIRELVEEMKLADEVGLDIYAIGEHHRKDFAVSAPEIILAAGAAVTKNIRLSSAVTVLSSADPIRVYQQYATIDAISNGRSEIMVGVVRLQNHSRCLVIVYRTMKNYLMKNWICLRILKNMKY